MKGEKINIQIYECTRKPEEKVHLGDLGVDTRITLKWTLK
jgi:hypothetical protein